jgi:hypothetical protein
VDQGEVLLTVHANQQNLLAEALSQLAVAVEWSDMPVAELPLFYEVIR